MIDTTEHKPASPDVMIGITSPRQFRMANELGRELRRRGRDVSYVAIKGRYGWFTSDWRVPARCLGEQHVEEFESPYIEQDTSLTPFQRCLRGMLPFIPFSAVSRLRKLRTRASTRAVIRRKAHASRHGLFYHASRGGTYSQVCEAVRDKDRGMPGRYVAGALPHARSVVHTASKDGHLPPVRPNRVPDSRYASHVSWSGM